jgi:predicted glycoside hydrolase/deacetylase ChbG (UPF0249 family)
MNRAVNAGILRAFREGCLTSTSILANAPEAESALVGWRELESERESFGLPCADLRWSLGDAGRPFDLGLHLNLTQGRPLTRDFPAALRTANGDFLPIGQLYLRLFALEGRYADGLRSEIDAQVEWLLDRGMTPTHVNGHQYIELIPAVARVLADVLTKHDIARVRFPCETSLAATTLVKGHPVAWLLGLVKRSHAARYSRFMKRTGFRASDRFFGTAHAGRVTPALLRHWLRYTHQDSTEIGLHPAEELRGPSPAGWNDPLAALRPQELAWLVSPELPVQLRQAGCRLGRIAD